jgi:glycosyltransferase involved in cell wall biosynthesis
MKTVVHTINLYDTGGVQSMFVPYYAWARQQSSFHHRVFGFFYDKEHYGEISDFRCLQGSFSNILTYGYHLLSRNSIVHFHNMLGGKRINQLLQFLPCSHIVFHEHGGVWNVATSEKKVCVNNAAKAQLILANSHATKIMLQKKMGIPEEKIKVVYNGFLNEPPRCPSEKREKKHVGFIGRLEAIKGVHGFLEAIECLKEEKNIVFKIAGSGPLEDDVKKAAAKCCNLEFVGRVRDPLTFISSLDVLVVPSVREPLGNVLIEAGFCRKAVIASQVDGIPELIENDVSGVLIIPTKKIIRSPFPLLPECVVNPTTYDLQEARELVPEELATTIKKVCNDDALRKRYGENLHSTVMKTFTLQHYCEQLESVYQSLLYQ